MWKWWSPVPEPVDPVQRSLRELGRREAQLWISATVVTTLAVMAFLTAALPLPPNPRFALVQVRFDQAAQALLALLLLFNTYVLYQRWLVRRRRKELTAATPEDEVQSADARELDPLTGFRNRNAAEQQLGKEMTTARRLGEPLSILLAGLEGFSEIQTRYGSAVSDQVVQEFARQLKKATRGSDFAARLGSDEFVAVLPGCPVASVQRVLGRLGPVALDCAGEELTVNFSAGWTDPQPGESPAEFLKRAEKMLQLYKDADTAERPAAFS